VRTSYPGEVVWYAGHWGWQFYADNANLRQISKSGAGPGAGEIVVVPKRVHKGHPPEGMLARVRRIDRWIYDARVPLRPTIGPGETFYCLTVPALPYLLESGDDRSLETFDIYRVGR
ncbi:MAG: hypothetical protein HKN20_10090, partial [Gemmatimonadetes bacterium]|nr:hypothetical protein [Gemmatimonadota bacterium]